MIAMRMRVSELKTTLLAAPNGTRFEVSRARGSFTLHQDPQRPAVFHIERAGIRRSATTLAQFRPGV
jgi:hypothetical protein